MKVEILWYIAARTLDLSFVVGPGDTKNSLMYWDSDGRHGGGWERDSIYATSYATKREATEAALLLAVQQPKYMGKLKLKRKRVVWQPAP